MSKYTSAIPDDIQKAIGWLLADVQPGKRFLDVGCSTGYFGEYIKLNFQNSVDGIEVSEDKILAKKVLDNVYSFDLDTPWPEEILNHHYDYVLFGDVLEHLKNPLLSLQEAKRILNKDGLVFVSVPNIAHISTRLELLSGGFQYEETGILDNTHLQYFTRETFEALANKAGYSIVSTDYSLNDFPDRIIKKLLNDVGLVPSKKFKTITDSVEARAYQYKFILKPSKNPVRARGGRKSLPPKPEHYRDSFIVNLESRISEIQHHADEQAKIIEDQRQDIIRLQKNPSVILKKHLGSIRRSFRKNR